jgi:hypothetical protein
MAQEVFVAFAAADRRVADAVVAHLELSGIRCWIAHRDIAAGVGWAMAIIEAIADSQVAVLILSSHANESPQLHREVERAVSNGIPLIPFRIEQVDPSPGLGYFIGSTHWLDAISPPLELHLDSLVRVVGTLVRRDPSEAQSREPVAVLPEGRNDRIAVDVEEGDALDFPADVLALKHASGAFYGVDKAVAARYLDRLGLPFPLPDQIGQGRVVESRRCIAAERIAVIGVPGLFDFGHREIRRFASAILQVLHRQPEPTRHLALTIQGAALLLDAAEVCETELGGLIDALDDGYIPNGLQRITFVERDPARAAKMRTAVERVLPDGSIPIRDIAEKTTAAVPGPENPPAEALAPFEPYNGHEPYLFVSYAHADGDQVFRHLDGLHAEGYRIWYDAGITPGTNWEDSIAEAIAGAEQVLVCVTPRSAASPHVRDEVSYALNKKKRFLAAFLEETELPPGLELRIGNKQAIMLFQHPAEGFANVIAQALVPGLRSRIS